jgi:hypothetical protein
MGYIRTFLNSKSKEWWSMATPEQNAINEMIWQLDQEAIKYEMVWGVYRLEALADENLAAKVQAQLDRLNAAIEAQDVDSVRVLVDGCIRMYAALEAAALAKGHTPQSPDFWEVKVGAKIYRVVKAVNDAHRAIEPSGCVVVSLQELVAMYDKKNSDFLNGVNRTKHDNAGKLVSDIDWDKGQEIPF